MVAVVQLFDGAFLGAGRRAVLLLGVFLEMCVVVIGKGKCSMRTTDKTFSIFVIIIIITGSSNNCHGCRVTCGVLNPL